MHNHQTDSDKVVSMAKSAYMMYSRKNTEVRTIMIFYTRMYIVGGVELEITEVQEI